MIRKKYTGDERMILNPEYFYMLFFKNNIIMSNTRAEQRDFLMFLKKIKRKKTLLISGLGLGMSIKMAFSIKELSKITVIEKEKEIIETIGSIYKKKYGKKLEIIHGDVFKVKNEEIASHDYAWHDIWPTISSSNYIQMKKIKDKFSKKISLFQLCWMEKECKNMHERGDSFI